MADYTITVTGPHRLGQSDTLTLTPLSPPFQVVQGTPAFDGGTLFTPSSSHATFDNNGLPYVNPADGDHSAVFSVTYTQPGDVTISCANDSGKVNPSPAAVVVVVIFPAASNVKQEIDRGDGVLGTRLGGGDVAVTSDTGGAGNLKIEKTLAGPAVGDVYAVAFLTSDYNADPKTTNVRGIAISKSDGTWSGMTLNSGANYTFVGRGADGTFFGLGPVTVQL